MFRKLMKYKTIEAILCRKKIKLYKYYSKIEKNEELLNFFQENLGISLNQTKLILSRYPSFNNISSSTLLHNITFMMEFGIIKGDIIKTPQVLLLHPITMKNYILLLEEGGFYKTKISPLVLSKFKQMTQKSIETLKNDMLIPKNMDVEQNLLSYVQLPSNFYQTDYNDLLSWSQVQENVLKLYIHCKLHMDYDSIEYALSIYHRLRNKSFRLVERTIDILLNELNFSEEKVRKHPYLIHSDPDNILNILNNCKELCGMDTKTVLIKHPKIILTPFENIQSIQKHFQDFCIPESTLSKAPKIYTLGSTTVYERLCQLKKTPELASFMSNPQVARLIYYYKKVNLRLNYLQSKNCVSIHLLASNSVSFNRFNGNGSDKVTSNDTMIYIATELDENKKKLRTMLARHPYWHYISLLKIRQTCEYLKRKKFTKEQICHNIQVLLYPKEKIDKALQDIQNMKDICFLKNSSGIIKTEFVLSLVLYNLEMEHHFSGDGVWSTNEKNKQFSSSASFKHASKDTEELDHVPSHMPVALE